MKWEVLISFQNRDDYFKMEIAISAKNFRKCSPCVTLSITFDKHFNRMVTQSSNNGCSCSEVKLQSSIKLTHDLKD